MNVKAPDTIEPARIDAPDDELPDLIADVPAKGEALGQKLPLQTQKILPARRQPRQGAGAFLR